MTPAAAVILAAATLSQPAAGPAAGPPEATSTVGIEGRVLVRVTEGGSLIAKPVERVSPMVLRIADSARDGDATIYDLRFIAQTPGAFDLRDFLEHGDGSAAADLRPILVEIGSLLPERHTGDLFEIPGLALPSLGGYRTLLIAGGVLWLAPLAWVTARRLRRKAAPVAERPGPARTLGDQLRPLLEDAIGGTLSTERCAELEMLLLAYWRRHRRLEGLTQSAAIDELRRDPEAGELLLALERWLHRPPAGREAVDLAGLLARYREIEPIELPVRAGDPQPEPAGVAT